MAMKQQMTAENTPAKAVRRGCSPTLERRRRSGALASIDRVYERRHERGDRVEQAREGLHPRQ